MTRREMHLYSLWLQLQEDAEQVRRLRATMHNATNHDPHQRLIDKYEPLLNNPQLVQRWMRDLTTQ